MRKRILSIVPLTALIAGAAIAAPVPVWYRDGSETGVRGRVTAVEPVHPSGAHVVIEDRDRVFVAPTANIAMYDVRPGDEVDARYIQSGDGEKSMLSMVPVFREIQAP
jgi:hypothetical protein